MTAVAEFPGEGDTWTPMFVLFKLMAGLVPLAVSDTARATARMPAVSPKLRPVRHAILGLTWCFAGLAGWCSDYVKVSGIAAPRRLKACQVPGLARGAEQGGQAQLLSHGVHGGVQNGAFCTPVPVSGSA